MHFGRKVLKCSMKNKLVIFCSSYPVDQIETALIDEIKYLKKSFQEIYIVPTDVPSNCFTLNGINIIGCSLEDFKFKKIHFLKVLFNSTCIREILYILFFKKSKLLCIKTAIIFFLKSRMLAAKITDTFEQSEKIVIYSYWGMTGSLASVFIKKKMKNVSNALRLHGWDLYEKANKLNYLPFRKLILKETDSVTTISENGRDYLLKRYDFSSLPKVFRLGTFNSKGLNPDSNEMTILSLSNLNEVKRIPLFIEVFKQFSLRVKWIHIGSGETFLQFVNDAEKNCPENVKFEAKGYLTPDQVKNFLANNHVTCLMNLSRSEGIPVSMMEALSYGIPVFATNVGGVSEIIDSNCGFLIEPNLPPEKIALKLSEFLNDNVHKKRIAARLKWELLFSGEKNYQLFSDMLETLKQLKG